MFAESLTKFNSGDLVYSCNESYTYSDYVDEMYEIGRAIHETINEYCRTINETAVLSIGSGDKESTTNNATANEGLVNKLKAIWNKIVESTIKAIENIYAWVYKQAVLHKGFIDKHKDTIMKTTLIYEKGGDSDIKVQNVKTKVLGIDTEEDVVIKGAVRTFVDSIKSYKNILTANLNISPLMSDSDLSDCISKDTGRVDKEKLSKKYKELILGSETKDTDIDIDEINRHKNSLIKNIDEAFNVIKRNKITMMNSNRLRRKPPTNLTAAEVDKFKTDMLNQVDSLKEYNKVLLEYCKIDSSILRMYIKGETDPKKDEKVDKKEEKVE